MHAELENLHLIRKEGKQIKNMGKRKENEGGVETGEKYRKWKKKTEMKSKDKEKKIPPYDSDPQCMAVFFPFQATF